MDAAIAKWSGTEGGPFRNDLAGGTRPVEEIGVSDFSIGPVPLNNLYPRKCTHIRLWQVLRHHGNRYSLPISRISRYQINTDIFNIIHVRSCLLCKCVIIIHPPGNSHSKMGSTCSQFMENLCSPELLKNGVPHQPEIWIDFRATKKQTNKTAGFHFREDHGSAEMSILGQVANKCWIYSGDLWM